MPSAADLPFTLQVAFNDHAYMMDLSKYRRQTLPALRQPLDTSTEPGEQSLNVEGLWRRSQSDWTLGAGQKFFDEDGSLRRRFWSSGGLDVWSKGELRLLNKPRLVRQTSNSQLLVFGAGGWLYFADGTTLLLTSNPEASSPTWKAANIAAGESLGSRQINSTTTDGSYVYAAFAVADPGESDTNVNGIHRTKIGSTSSNHFSSFRADLVKYVNGRLVACGSPGVDSLGNPEKANQIVEVFSDGTFEEIFTHRSDGFRWRTIAGSPNAVYLAGASGDRCEIYAMSLDDFGAFSSPTIATQLPDGELVNHMTFYGGVMLLATTAGLRLGRLTGGGALVYGPVIEIDGGVNRVEAQGEFVWFTWTGFGADELVDGTSDFQTGLGRVNLARFTSTLVPAYASDLMVGTELAPITAKSCDVTTFEERRYFAIANTGLYGESDEVGDTGWLRTGWIRYGTVEPKVVASLDLRHAPLSGSIEASLHTEQSGQEVVGESKTVSSLGPESAFEAQLQVGEQVMVELNFRRGGVDAGPSLTWWTLRALPVPKRIDEIVVPLIIKTRVDSRMGEGQAIYYDTLAEFNYLQSLVGTGEVVNYQEGTESYDVYVDRLQVEPAEWNDDRTFFESTVTLRLLVFDLEG